MENSFPINKYLLATIVLFTIPISGLCIDIYVPSLPAVAAYFHADKALVQLTITVYMIGLAVMQLFAGSLSDSFGRKKPFAIGMLIYIFVTFFIPFSQTIYQLLTLRFIQGASIAITVVPLRSVFTDIFEEKELYKMFNYLVMAWSIGPIIAPAIGGYLQHYFGWEASFYLLATYSMVMFVLALIYLPETSTHRHPFRLFPVILRYCKILFHWHYTTGLLLNGFLYSFIILFSIVGPFLIQTQLHYSAAHFGQVALITGLAWFLGTMTNRFLINISPEVKMKHCLMTILGIVIVMLAIAQYPITIYRIVIPIVCLLWVGGIAFPNYFARSLSYFPDMTGSANALFGASVFLIAGISSSIGTLLKSTTEVPLTLAYLVIITLCLLIYFIDRNLD